MAYNSEDGVLHNIMLPRSWFINLTLPGTDLEKDISTFSVFVSTTIELMEQIDLQVECQGHPVFAFDVGDQFIADGTRVTSLTGPIYIARM